MPNVMISGANRGIGLELARQYSVAGWTIYATVRDLNTASDLRALGDNVHILQLEVTDAESIKKLASDLSGVPLDIVIANSGVSDGNPAIDTIMMSEFLRVMTVNSLGPVNMMAALLPNLLLGSKKIAVAMSSLMSSITSNNWGTEPVYRASKTALNAMWATLALEWRPQEITCLLIRPGMVKTRMTQFRGIDPEESVAGIRKVLDSVSFADTGRLIGYDGLPVPW